MQDNSADGSPQGGKTDYTEKLKDSAFEEKVSCACQEIEQPQAPEDSDVRFAGRSGAAMVSNIHVVILILYYLKCKDTNFSANSHPVRVLFAIFAQTAAANHAGAVFVVTETYITTLWKIHAL
ncbi:MAG: hypothetical protein K2F91_01125 [Muribaculaceae bacterium]|nr:hypothetical protein [Muribaculaceae bacterium]